MTAFELPSISQSFRHHRRLGNESRVLSRAIVPLIRGCGTLVDIGAGDGSLTRILAQGRRVIAIEPSLKNASALKRALSGTKHEVICEPMENVELPARSVEALLFCHVLYYLQDVHGAVDRAFNWLKPGGVAVFVLLSSRGDQASVISKYWKRCRGGGREIESSPARLEHMLREFTTNMRTGAVQSHRSVRTKSEQDDFLSFVLDVPSRRLPPEIRTEFKQFISRKRLAYRPRQASTFHEFICVELPLAIAARGGRAGTA
jgi:SAM-dependent methyltransferase